MEVNYVKKVQAFLQAMWYSTIEKNSIYTPTKRGCRKDGQVVDGEGKEYA